MPHKPGGVEEARGELGPAQTLGDLVMEPAQLRSILLEAGKDALSQVTFGFSGPTSENGSGLRSRRSLSKKDILV
ncbi:hypothetical protein JRQ81_010389 [Phrynocephalus forsythii]|uniref:Uncharacterized protein n=1 Tax=Phrynocephalus forsythii TaxID=171643 RepID=A0A9Q0X911_9SAUR|nr:hypothetical protein JRQ81_010389 [Phrynocephalus forsythii]